MLTSARPFLKRWGGIPSLVHLPRKRTSTFSALRKPPCPYWSGLSLWACKAWVALPVGYTKITEMLKAYHDNGLSLSQRVMFYSRLKELSAQRKGPDTGPAVCQSRGNRSNETPCTWQLGQLKNHIGILVRIYSMIFPVLKKKNRWTVFSVSNTRCWTQ